MINEQYDCVILGLGTYGLYCANKLAKLDPSKKILILEKDSQAFQRASYVNQARVHNGYHYPRSLSTALKSAKYYQRFIKDYDFAINSKFEKIYAISSDFSYASGENFKDFCNNANIKGDEIDSGKFFKEDVIDQAFVTEEFSLDAKKICKYFLSNLRKSPNVEIRYSTIINKAEKEGDNYHLKLSDKSSVYSNFIINATYASINQILNIFGFDNFKIKYEIAEICLGNVSNNILNIGLTVMDGPFFSLMPFGLSGLHSLSGVNQTPHKTSYDKLPTFDCQKENKNCTKEVLDNCNLCIAKPKTAWTEMHQLAKRYLKGDIEMTYKESLFAIKPILQSSEISDSRPTIIKEFCNSPRFVSVLSGKFNTIYDLDQILKW